MAYGGTMSRVLAALVLTLLTATACGGSSEGRGRLPRGPGATDAASTTTTVVGPEVEGEQIASTSIPVLPVTPALPPPAAPSGGLGGPFPRRGLGCRRAPYPKCSQTNKRPCCRPGDPGNARFRQGPNPRT
jgi:hypothetical protein